MNSIRLRYEDNGMFVWKTVKPQTAIRVALYEGITGNEIGSADIEVQSDDNGLYLSLDLGVVGRIKPKLPKAKPLFPQRRITFGEI